ncbi:MAG TPA: glycoside hydrolase family 13 protein [Candidatus Limnocylindrales bacterium]
MNAPSPADGWWRRAVVYQVYIRSFADSDGDGYGDIAGIRSRLGYLRSLGVDAIWITPWYPSPMEDGGYDVADYRDVDPLFGTLDDADALLADAHAAGIRVLVDLVPNHTSAAHPWFREALVSPAGSPARSRYVFRDGRGPGGADPPTNWRSVFGGPAWTRVVEPDLGPGPSPGAGPAQWYLHLFDPSQPDLNWEDPEVRAEFESILRFWFDRGVDGFRIDVASALVKDQAFPDLPPEVLEGGPYMPDEHPHWGRPGVHDIYRSWRRIARSYPDERVLLGEVHVSKPARLALFLRPDELQGAFNFQFMRTPFEASRLREIIDETLQAHTSVGAAPTWVLSNHDETRHVTRFGRPFSGIRERLIDSIQPTDLALGTRCARAAIMLILALPGSAYLYEGEELGLWQVTDLPAELIQDPIWERTGHADPGRDGCRVPIPWSGDAPPFGFGPAGSVPWLPQPPEWRDITVEAESRDPSSMLSLYRAAIRLRRTHPGLADESFRWLPVEDGVVAFERSGGFRCLVNLSGSPLALPSGGRVLLASDPLVGRLLPADASVWLEGEP